MKTTFNRLIIKETGFAFDTTSEVDGLVSMWEFEAVRKKSGIRHRKGIVIVSNDGLTAVGTEVVFNFEQAKECSIGDGETYLMLQNELAEAKIEDNKLHPLGSYVLATPYIPEEVTESGFILPGAIDEKKLQAKVVFGGDKVVQVKQGDIVLYGRTSGHSFSFKGVQYRLMREDTIYGIFA